MSKIMYLHGLEGSPNGVKATYLRERYTLVAPSLPAYGKDINNLDEIIASLENCVPIAKNAIQKEDPTLIVASSFGGAVLMRLYQEGFWNKPSVFLAQGAIFLNVGNHLPKDARAIFIHGLQDDLVSSDHSKDICSNAGENVEFWPVNDDHGLCKSLHDGTIERAIDTLLKRLANQ